MRPVWLSLFGLLAHCQEVGWGGEGVSKSANFFVVTD